MIEYELVRGSSITIPFVVTEGSVTDASEVTCTMKRLSSSGVPFPGDSGIDLPVTVRPATLEVAEGWNVYIDDSVSALFSRDKYIVDLRLIIGAGVEIKPAMTIKVVEGASSP